VSREIFEQQHQAEWAALDRSLMRLEDGHVGRGDRRGRSEHSVPADLPELYRQICHHLALVRHRRYGADLELRLNRLVLRGHQQLYQKHAGGLAQILDFARSGFPRLVRSEGRLVGLSALLFAVPLLLMTLFVPHHPEVAFSILSPAEVEQMGQQFAPAGSLEAGRPVDSDVLMFGFYIRNNIGIAFRTFATGILGGVGSIFFLVYNGLSIGTVTGYVRQMGFGPQFFPFAIGHGAFELTAIVLAGAAGLRMGLALLAPGPVTRGRALLLAGRVSIRMLYGAAGMLVIAAFLEAFWSPLPQPAATKYGVGAVLWLSVLVYLAFAGRPQRGS
jgi:uncharacterized membrane protein SpoIIM required for sporulation